MAQKENIWLTFTLMNRWIFTVFTLIFAWLATACDFHELPEAIAPVQIRGILMINPDSAATNHELFFVQSLDDGERIIHGSAVTDELGIFEFEYARNNKINGGRKCRRRCDFQCPGLEIWHEGSLLAKCFPTNKRYDLELYLSNTMNVRVTMSVDIQVNDTFFLNLVPIDTNDPNYFRGNPRFGRSVEAFRLTGPIDSGTVLTIRTRMEKSVYEGLQGPYRGESAVVIADNIDFYAVVLHEIRSRGNASILQENIGFTRVRFRGEPYGDVFTISARNISR